jgi:hypothetical protein
MRVALLSLCALLVSSTAFAEKGWRRKDGGPALSAGLELSFSHVRLTGQDRLGNVEGNIIGAGTLISGLTVLEFDYFFSRYVGLGIRAGVGRIFNSDELDSIHTLIGPTLTVFMGHVFYLGIDAFLQFLRFDDSPSSVHGTDDFDEEFSNELSADALLGFNFGLRFGLVFEVASVVTVVPELRLGVQPVTVVNSDGTLFYSAPSSGTVTIDAESALVFGGGIGLCARFFL